jgi:hypothetical protein
VSNALAGSRAMMRSRSIRTVAIAWVAVTGVCACGTAQRDSDAAAVVSRFQSALAEPDDQTACAQLSEATESKLEQQEKKPCQEAILDLQLPEGGRAVKTSVYVTTAAVLSAEGGTTFLDEGPDGWEISAAGCQPAVPDLPYDCELEG